MQSQRSHTASFTAVLLSVLMVLGAFGCSSGDGPVTAPELTSVTDGSRASQANRVLWSMWHVSIDPATLVADLTPLRGAAFTANVTRFMQPPSSPANMVSITVDGSSNPVDGYFVIDIALSHPFPGMDFYNGFDVRGVLYSDGSVAGEHDNSVLRVGPGDTTLLNADGHTRWWNWQEFTSYETVFGASQGALAPPNQPTSTVNGYKYFADGLGLEDAMTALDPSSRGFFSSAGSNVRRYEIQFKMSGGKPVFDFNYAIDAGWEAPDEGFAPEYPVEAFPLSANCQEAFHVDVTDAGSTAYYVDATSNGGELVLGIEVYDWQGGANGDVPAEIAGIYLEGDILTGVVDVMSTASVLDGSTFNSSVYEITIGSLNLTGSGVFNLFGTVESADPTTFKPQIPGGSAFDYPDSPLAAYFTCTVTVLSESPNPDPTVTGIDPDEGIPDCTPEPVTVTGTDFVDGATFRLERDGETDIDAENVNWIDENTLEGDLFLAGSVSGLWDVTVENPGGPTGTLADAFTILDAIYVDGDNMTGVEDGTPENPFNTIQEGINAAYASNDEPVIVDQAAVDYSPFTLRNNSHVIGCNWNDGVGWAVVDQTNVHTYGNNVNDVTIEGLHFDLDLNSGSPCYGMVFSSGDGLSITECRFTGIITCPRAYIIRLDQTQNIEISYCEFTEIFHRAPDTGYRTYNILYGARVDTFSVHHCEFHNIGFDQPDAGAHGNGGNILSAAMSYAIPCQNVDFHNLLIYDIFDKTDCIRPSPNPDPQNHLSIIGGSRINAPSWTGEFKLYNITIDNVRHADPPSTTTVNAGHVNGGYFYGFGGTDIAVKNNIVSNVEPTDDWVVSGNTSYYGWWVDGWVNGGSTPYPMDYSLVYNVGKPLPPGENGSNGWFYGWANLITKGTGCYGNNEDIDPEYDMTAGDDFYHPTNTLISEGADDGSEMGAFGGPEGDWIPPSQL